ncbi:hypothetical protein Ddye_015897 [Dipteronia dyeriana]|uniref:PGG domain-containing protein n=1 Tax=Dipteronia dyeriana TaxID=168575 RepID=A0AAD9WZK9_9ROSI|nr:hypothetical protein Ddye_015897 [Dipteronia dyeriana]
MNKETAAPDDQTKKRWFKNAMKGEWGEVVQIYSDNPSIHKAKITRSGGTALHIAVSDGKEDIVKKLLDLIKDKSPTAAQEVLRMGDEIGNTPLHTAAMLGNVKMCRCIAVLDKSLIGVRNQDSETPFFLAASHGHKDAFLCLHFLCQPPNHGSDYCRRNTDGDTILHSAISGDYFDLAFQIIHYYEGLVNSVNQRGLSPLHLLAAKPSAFRSGSHLGRCNEFIYHCIFVDKLEVEISDNYKDLTPNHKTICPANYETCNSLITLLLKGIKIVTNRAKDCTFDNVGKPDAENPREGDTQHERKAANDTQGKNNQTGGGDDDSNSFKAQGHQLFPPNYSVCFELVKLVSKTILVILGLGSNKIRKIREKKQKNTWSIQVMNELLKRASMYEYEDDGKKPQQSPPQPGDDSHDETKPYEIGAGGDVTFVKESFVDNQQLTGIVSGANQHDQKDEKDAQDKNQTVNKGEISEMQKKEEEKNLENFPVALHDMNYEKKNAVLTLAVENRQPHVYQLLLNTKEEISEIDKKESPILIAAKNGITEIVEKILENFPVALHDINYQKKNVVLLAVESRQPHVYQLLLKMTNKKESVFRKVDHEGNSALHLAARLGDHKPWLIPGTALQMQWEIKWYEFVKDSMPFHFFVRYNKASKSPRDVFTETHKELVKSGGDWLTNTSESCSVVAALIATVAFATSSTVPGGVRADSGTPTLENEPAFNLFAITSLIALCFSVTAVVMFLAILTSRYQEQDFGSDLPRKLLVGLTSLFVSIASMLVSFCSGHFFVLKDKLKFAAFPVYAVTCLPITFFAVAQFPLYFDLIWAAFKKVPQRSYKSIPI